MIHMILHRTVERKDFGGMILDEVVAYATHLEERLLIERSQPLIDALNEHHASHAEYVRQMDSFMKRNERLTAELRAKCKLQENAIQDYGKVITRLRKQLRTAERSHAGNVQMPIQQRVASLETHLL